MTSSQASSYHSFAGGVVGTRYRVGKKIGEGSFGGVFEGINLANGSLVAVKVEPRKTDSPQLRDEYRAYRALAGTPGIPQAYYFGREGLDNVLVIDLFGPNLEDLFEMCGRKFSIKCVCMLARQMLTRIQAIHDRSIVYRDIKPDNFLIGVPGAKNANAIYVIDFGMAKLYRDPKTKLHVPYRERKSLSGTPRYMSINTHLGREQSRRDDIEALGHVFMYFLRGGLPWQGLKAATNKQKYEKIGEAKRNTPISELCKGFPEEFEIYMNYARTLDFDGTPDYQFLQRLFANVLKNNGDVEDGVYDWMLLNGGKGWEASVSNSTNHSQANANAAIPKDRDRERRHKPGERERERSGVTPPLHMPSPRVPPNALVASNNVVHTDAGGAALPSASPPEIAITPPVLTSAAQKQKQQQQQQQSQQSRHRLPSTAPHAGGSGDVEAGKGVQDSRDGHGLQGGVDDVHGRRRRGQRGFWAAMLCVR